MRRGCGCLTGILTAGLCAGALVWAAILALDVPSGQQGVGWGPADRASGQRKIATLLTARRGAPAELVLTEPELTALLDRHLTENAGYPVAHLAVRLPAPGRVAVGGRIPASRLAGEVGLGGALDLLPRRWSERPVWIHLELRARTIRDGRHRLHLDATRLYVGRLPVPARLHRMLLSPSTLGLLEWTLPATVETVTVERGRLVVRLSG
jgi:hypothetical protein